MQVVNAGYLDSFLSGPIDPVKYAEAVEKSRLDYNMRKEQLTVENNLKVEAIMKEFYADDDIEITIRLCINERTDDDTYSVIYTLNAKPKMIKYLSENSMSAAYDWVTDVPTRVIAKITRLASHSNNYNEIFDNDSGMADVYVRRDCY